jgi:cytochrome c-type biogenesis protein CcmH
VNGLVILVLLIAGTSGLLWLLKVRGPLLKLSIAGLMLGAVGYALQGRPALPGESPAVATNAAPIPLQRARHAFFGEFTGSERWHLIAESFSRRGKATEAAGVMQTAVRKYPGDPSLWIGFGNALVDQAGELTPAGELAFARAEELAPEHPAPRFFHGLAIARSGDPQRAVAIWREILAGASAEAPWRPLVEDGVAALAAAGGPQTDGAKAEAP